MTPATARDRAQSQVSTLIVFIALMLIVTMTAGAVFDVTGALQLRSEDTGERSNQQIVEHLEPIATIGVVNGTGEVQSVDLILRMRGAGSINVSGVIVEVVSDQGVDRLTPGAPGLSATALRDDDTSLQPGALLMNGPTDRVNLTIDLAANAAAGGENGPWAPGETATVTLDSGGRETVLELRVPTYLGDSETIAL